MIPERTISRRFAVCLLLLSAVLVLGIVQWSFLPLLIQNGPSTGAPLLEFSAGHTSKFAAPYKALFGDGWNPCLAQTGITVRPIVSRIAFVPDAPISGPNDVSLTHHPLRAPPSA